MNIALFLRHLFFGTSQFVHICKLDFWGINSIVPITFQKFCLGLLEQKQWEDALYEIQVNWGDGLDVGNKNPHDSRRLSKVPMAERML